MSPATPVRRPFGRTGAALLALLAAAMILAPSGVRPASADQLSDKQKQRNQLAQLMKNLKAQIQATQVQEQQLENAIDSLDGQIAATEQRISDAQVRLDQIQADLVAAQAHLAEVLARMERDKKELAGELVLIYKQGQTSTINRLVGASSFNEFWQKLIDLRRLAGSQQDLLRTVQQEKAEADALVVHINDQKRAQRQLLSDLHGQAADLQSEMTLRQQAVQRLEQAKAQEQQQLSDAEKSLKEVDAEIQAIKDAMAAAARRGGGNGHFVWPEQGPISQYFGCTSYPAEPWDPDCPQKHFHTGLDIADPWGTPVGAGDAGIAYTYVSSYGYGNHVIIVHGNGWVSVYGHLASFAVGNGQGVGRGQTIGYEGSTGNSSGPHLHFEVRYNDQPVNPLSYLS